MPDGGPDNCFNCIHNEANHGEGLRNLAVLDASWSGGSFSIRIRR